MRQIKASEVKPGMTIRWEQEDLVLQFPVAHTIQFGDRHLLRTPMRKVVTIPHDTEVTVLTEPAPVQPEEPRWIAARAKVGDRRFFRVDESDRPWRKADCMGRISSCRYSWSDVCSLGPVTVILDLGWTVPDDTPEVPERIEEWPEDDEALRPYPWQDTDGDEWCWHWAEDGWGYNHATFPKPFSECFPLIRVTDA